MRRGGGGGGEHFLGLITKVGGLKIDYVIDLFDGRVNCEKPFGEL